MFVLVEFSRRRRLTENVAVHINFTATARTPSRPKKLGGNVAMS
jgi:hypothetical protein